MFAAFVLSPVNKAAFPGGALPPLVDEPVLHPERVQWEELYQ